MDFINKVEIKGIVGSAKQSLVGHYLSVRFSVCTENPIINDGNALIENTWFQCVAIDVPNMEQIEKGKVVHVTGRFKMHGYIDSGGNERYVYEVICKTIKVSDR